MSRRDRRDAPPNFAPAAPISPSAAAAAFRRGAFIDLAPPTRAGRSQWGDGRRGRDRRLHQYRRDCRGRPHRRGLSGSRGGGRRVWRRRRSGTWRRSAAISPSARAAGTIRNPHIACLKKGGAICPAREGNHLYGVAFDLGPCVAPHPSTLAAALLAYDATVTTNLRQRLTHRTTCSATAPTAAPTTRWRPAKSSRASNSAFPLAASARSIGGRSAAAMPNGRWSRSWSVPIIADGTFRLVRIVAGGIAPVPIRLRCRRIRGAGSGSERRDHRQGGRAIHAWRDAARHDRLQTRSA